jgi:hypothetical protein
MPPDVTTFSEMVSVSDTILSSKCCLCGFKLSASPFVVTCFFEN